MTMAKRRYISLKDWIICISHGKLVATGDDLEELRKRAECASPR